MHNVRKLGLQVFAAPDNMTGKAQIHVQAREIDFVTSFGKNLKALLDILGIARMVRKENNSVLKTKTVKGELQSGDVGEGEEIPMSRYTVEETPFDTIRIEKYRKGVSLEAIAEKGYEAAVQDTDEEFKSDLQNVVTDKFYAQLKAGSLTGHETTWQMAVAMAIGKVVDKFQKMKRTATGVAVWVNTLDVYKYLGAADITLQTAFGFKYLTNFLGADVVFVTSEVPQNVVIATPLNNMIAYYVDPGDSEFAKAGLGFTTDSETGFIGFHSEGTYSRMISDNYAIMGLRLFCEYLDAIAYISVGESDTQTLGTLIKHFIDLHDNDHSYNEGDIFPREGVDVSEERLKELAGSDNKQHTPLIELVEEDPDNTAGADTAEKTSKAGKKKPENKVPENKEPAE